MLTQANSSIPSNPGAVFREGLAASQLRYMKCRQCDAAQTLARYACQRCGSVQLDWFNSNLKGSVYAVTTVTRAPSDEFRVLAPYTLLLVDLQEGPRLMGHGELNLVIGDRVTASFEELGEKGLVFFRRTLKGQRGW